MRGSGYGGSVKWLADGKGIEQAKEEGEVEKEEWVSKKRR